MSTFVSVGNSLQPIGRLLEAVKEIAARLPQPVFVQHGHTPFECRTCETRAFLDMPEFEQRVSAADVLIMHAGAGSVLHAVRVGKVPVVMPRRRRHGEHIDDHQLRFGQELARMNRVVLVEEPSELAVAVGRALAMQQKPASLRQDSQMLRLVAERLAACAEKSA